MTITNYAGIIDTPDQTCPTLSCLETGNVSNTNCYAPNLNIIMLRYGCKIANPMKYMLPYLLLQKTNASRYAQLIQESDIDACTSGTLSICNQRVIFVCLELLNFNKKLILETSFGLVYLT